MAHLHRYAAGILALGLLVATSASAAAQASNGKTLYLKNCRTCHGTTGEPTHLALSQYPKIPRFADSAFQAGISDDSMKAVLMHGAGKDMKSFEKKLTPAEMDAVIEYVRTLAKPKSSG